MPRRARDASTEDIPWPPKARARNQSSRPRGEPPGPHPPRGGEAKDGVEVDYEDESVYDSDDQTQVFYESTDDSDDEPTLSVADAVAGLNKRRGVKGLFGML